MYFCILGLWSLFVLLDVVKLYFDMFYRFYVNIFLDLYENGNFLYWFVYMIC